MAITDFRARIIDWLSVLAGDADTQLKAVEGLPEELRLCWEDCFVAVDANDEALAQFTPSERAALIEFDEYMWSLPPEPFPMWHRAALNDAPWPEVRARAAELLDRLKSPN